MDLNISIEQLHTIIKIMENEVDLLKYDLSLCDSPKKVKDVESRIFYLNDTISKLKEGDK